MASGQLNQFMEQFRQEQLPRAAETCTDGQLLKRFAAGRDEAAFEALVQRHGPMVLGLCRRLLRDASDADDAFQATFLVLVRKAGSISQPELLGNWLYGVAYRVATKARANAARRSAHERQAASMPKPDSTPASLDWDLRAVLDEELSHLPEKYRAPLVLCYLEGKTNEEAARLMGCPAGSMSWRLSRGRELLRQRLSRRRLSITPMLLAPLLMKSTASAAVPPLLMKATVKAAVVAAGQATTVGVVSVKVAALTEETVKAMWEVPFKFAAWSAAVLLGGTLLLATLGYVARPTTVPPPGPAAGDPAPGNCSSP